MNWGDEDEGTTPTATAPPKALPKSLPDTAAAKAAKYADHDDDEKPLPAPVSTEIGNMKTVVTYTRRDDGKIEKKTTKFVLEKRKISVSKAVLQRRTWGKFGDSTGLPPGPDASSTNTVNDDIYLTLSSKQEIKDDADEEKSLADKLQGKKLVMCRICKGDHWTTKCPYKDSLVPDRPDGAEGPVCPVADADAGGPPPGGPPAGGAAGEVTGSTYVPVHKRAGRGGGREGGGSSMNDRDDSNTIRVTNISENTREDDLRDLFRGYGHISRCYLATDRNTGQARGFAFINFLRREDAQRAIDGVNGHGYDHLILQVEWAEERKPADK